MCSRTNGSSHYQVTNKANNEKSGLFSEDGKIEKKKQPKKKDYKVNHLNQTRQLDHQ